MAATSFTPSFSSSPSAAQSVHESIGFDPVSSGSGSGAAAQSTSNWMMDLMNYQNGLNNQYTHEQWHYNSVEAQKNRDWMEYMSNTAHQREVKDLLAAGLNPVLSAMNGNGASTPTGQAASGTAQKADTSALSAYTSIMVAGIQAASAASVAKIYTENQRYLAEHFPTSKYAFWNSLVGNIFDSDGISGALDRIKEQLIPFMESAQYHPKMRVSGRYK